MFQYTVNLTKEKKIYIKYGQMTEIFESNSNYDWNIKFTQTNYFIHRREKTDFFSRNR